MSDTNFIISATDKTKAAFASVEKGFGSLKSHAFSLGATVTGLAGAAGFGALMKISGDTADTLAKVSDRTDIATEKLAGLQYAVGQTSEVSGETFVNSLTKMNAKIAEAAIKGGENAKVIEQMGLSVHSLANMKADEQFEAISEAMRGVHDEGQRAYFAQKLMDEQGVKLVNTMALGKEGLAEYTKEAQAFGIAVSRADAAKIEESNDQMDRLGKAVLGIATTVRVHLSPYISVLARYFADAARESDGFKTQTLWGLEKVASGVAFMGDMWRGLSVVWKGLEVVFWTFVSTVVNGVWAADHAVRSFIDLIPGLEAKPNATLAEWAQDASQKVLEAQVSLADLAMQPLPSDGIKQFFADVQAEAEASAQKVAESRAAMAAGTGPYSRDTSDADAKTAEKFAKLNESLLTENERLRLHYEEQAFIVEDAYQIGLISEMERKASLEQLEAQHQQKMNAIAYNGMATHEKFATAFRRLDVRNALAFGAELTAGVAQQSRTMFNINKALALALANAAVALPDAVMQSFRNGGGYPWGLIPAGLMLATGLTQIAAINSTQFGSGGSAPSLAGQGGGGSTVNTVPIGGQSSTPAPLPGAGARASARDFNLTVKGSSISVETLREEIAPMLEQAAADGAFNLNVRVA